MTKKLKVALCSMEAGIQCLSDQYQQANYRGGLGLLVYDIIGALSHVFHDMETRVFVPLYPRLWYEHDTLLYYHNALGDPDYTLFVPLRLNGAFSPVHIWHKTIEGQLVTLLQLPDAENLSFLYTEDRLARLRQQVLFSRAVMRVMEKDAFAPDVLWLNECATGLLAPMIRSDPAFPLKPKVLYTNHTTERSAWEFYQKYQWDKVGIDDHCRAMFVEGDTLDLMNGLMKEVDMINGVSEEHESELKNLFPHVAHKITHVTNGVHPAHWMLPELYQAVRAGHNPTGKKILTVHERARAKFFEIICEKTGGKQNGRRFSADRFTLGYNRRFQGYKNNHWPRLYLSAIVAPYGKKVRTELGELEGLGGQFVAAGMAPATDADMLDEIRRYKDACASQPYAAFIEESSIPLMEAFAWGLDLHLSMPELHREAAGTSPDRCAQNGVPTIANWTGSVPEWMRHFEWKAGTGNGFVVRSERTSPIEQYYQAHYFAMLWHMRRKGNGQARIALETLAKNVFEAGKKRDIAITLQGYHRLIRRLCKK